MWRLFAVTKVSRRHTDICIVKIAMFLLYIRQIDVRNGKDLISALIIQFNIDGVLCCTMNQEGVGMRERTLRENFERD